MQPMGAQQASTPPLVSDKHNGPARVQICRLHLCRSRARAEAAALQAMPQKPQGNQVMSGRPGYLIRARDLKTREVTARDSAHSGGVDEVFT